MIVDTSRHGAVIKKRDLDFLKIIKIITLMIGTYFLNVKFSFKRG